MFDFKIKSISQKSKARTGTITTPHGKIETPAFVTVGTKGSVKSLLPNELDIIGTQFVFANTYHLVLSPGAEFIEKAGGIHNFSKIQKPMITDSGGFQVFSLARQNKKEPESPTLVKITDDGVSFRSHIDGSAYFFSPEFSIASQQKIGADFIVAFDECLPVGVTEAQTLRSLSRTHDWAKRSLKVMSGVAPVQEIYGVIQGGMYEKCRVQSAEFIASLPFWGLAIGGVSVGETKEEMRAQVSWVMEVINGDGRARHLLGIGHLDDIIEMVKMGIDTFDCVVPTRMARMGRVYLLDGEILELLENTHKNSLAPIDVECRCDTCINFTRGYLHHLFKQRELLAYRLATIHNLTFMENYFAQIRNNIAEGKI